MKKKVIIAICIVIILVGIIFVINYKDLKNIEVSLVPKFEKLDLEAENVYLAETNIPNNLVIDNKYEKRLDDIIIKLDIPDDWKYEELSKNEENDFYKFALKIYKNNSEKYAVLYYYNRFFGVCGTGRSVKQIELDNGYNANIGYYWSNEVWEDISFYELNKNIAIINYGLEKDEADELVNIIKTLDVTEGKTE